VYRMSLRQICCAACALKCGSTEGSQACVSGIGASLRQPTMWIVRRIRASLMMRSFACITSVIRTYNLLVLLFATTTVQRKYCVVSPCWMKKNDVAKMRQAGTAPATGTTIYCPTSLWCTVIYKLLALCTANTNEGDNPHYHSIVGMKLLHVDWERTHGLQVSCPDAACSGTLCWPIRPLHSSPTRTSFTREIFFAAHRQRDSDIHRGTSRVDNMLQQSSLLLVH